MRLNLKDLTRRHHVTVQDGAFVIGVIVLIGYIAYETTFIAYIPASERIEFEEMIVLGAVIIALLLYFGWRRVVDQEREIGRRVAAERRAHELAHTDALTGLANRRQFEATLKTAVNTPCSSKEVHAVLLLDLTGFKKVNDIYGHPEGDDLLVVIAERLKPLVRDRDLVARVGGDEFAIIGFYLTGVEGATNIAMRIVKELDVPIQIGTRRHNIGVGVGVALIPRDGDNAEELLRKADIALYRAKHEPQSAVRFFEEDMDRHVRERDFIERELAAAIGTDALRPWYQPIVDLKTGEVVAFEALARWTHPTLGAVSPERFVSIAEGGGLMPKLGDWLLRCAAVDAREWPAHVLLSFNISPKQLQDETFGLRILSILAETGLVPQRLEIEITESAIVHDLESARGVLASLRDAGVRIALDDFGTGYSSLYHLRNFRLDKIKIDRSFIHSMNSERESSIIVHALAGLGKGLGLTITAEGVEEGSERDTLLQLGCEQGQGYLFGRAVPASETGAFLTRSQIRSQPAA